MKYEITCPLCGNNQIYQPRKEVPKQPHTKCSKCKKEFNFSVGDPDRTIIENEPKPLEKKLPTSTQKHPPQETSFIDDPNELLLSVAIRELNKPNPDPRWASILINCKKEKITNTNEVIDQFKNLPTQALVNLLNKSSQEEY